MRGSSDKTLMVLTALCVAVIALISTGHSVEIGMLKERIRALEEKLP